MRILKSSIDQSWQELIGESLFLRKLVLGIPAQASIKNLTRALRFRQNNSRGYQPYRSLSVTGSVYELHETNHEDIQRWQEQFFTRTSVREFENSRYRNIESSSFWVNNSNAEVFNYFLFESDASMLVRHHYKEWFASSLIRIDKSGSVCKAYYYLLVIIFTILQYLKPLSFGFLRSNPLIKSPYQRYN